MLLGRLSCLFNFHKAQRKSVAWNGFHYQGTCRSCGKKVRRVTGGGWRSLAPQKAAHAPEEG